MSESRGAASVTLDTISANALESSWPPLIEGGATLEEITRAVTDALASEAHEVWMCSRCESLRSAPIPHFAGVEDVRCPGEWVRGSWIPS